MATIQSIAARREVALQRIARSLRITLKPVKGVADLRHAFELEQIADELDPEGRAPAVSPADGAMREAPFTRHEDTVQPEGDGGRSPDAEETPAAVAVAPEPPAPTVPSAQPQRTPDHVDNPQPQQQQRPQRVHGRR